MTFNPRRAIVMTNTKLEVKGQFVQKLECKQTDTTDCSTLPASAAANYYTWPSCDERYATLICDGVSVSAGAGVEHWVSVEVGGERGVRAGHDLKHRHVNERF